MAQSLATNRGMDWISLSVYLSLVVIGWLMLYATVYDGENNYSFLDLSSTIGKQSLWIIISLFIGLCVLLLDWKAWFTFSYPVYFIAVLMLILVLIFGVEIKGSKSWFSIFGMSFQPSEFAKLGTCLALASFLSFHNSNLKKLSTIIIALAMVFIPMTLILLQPDAGSAVVFLSFFILFYREGLSKGFYIIAFLLAAVFITSLMFNTHATGLLLILGALMIFSFSLKKSFWWPLLATAFTVAAIILFSQGWTSAVLLVSGSALLMLGGYLWVEKKGRIPTIVIPAISILAGISLLTNYGFSNFLKPHQQERINVWLKPEICDPKGSLYNIIQSKLAIGSGGFAGKGFLNGSLTKLNYVPEQTTDFIFSTIGEEQGFIGSIGVIILFLILLYRITVIAERSKIKFIRHYAYGFAGLLFAHFFINIGMTMGLMPVIGIPLPYISQGGSSFLIFSLMFAILLKMDYSRYRIVR